MKVLKSILCGLATILCSGGVAPAEEIVSVVQEVKVVEVTAYGKDYNSALKDGLLDAVARVSGKIMELSQELDSKFTTVAAGGKDDFSGKEEFKGRVKELSRGLIKEYDVVSQAEQKDGRWVVTIRVSVSTKIPQEYSGRKRIVVLPFGYYFEVDSKIFSRGEEGWESTERAAYPGVRNRYLAGLFENALESYLVQTRRFMILDRRHAAQVSVEQGVIMNGSATLDDLIKVTTEVPADLIVIGKLEDVSYSRKSEAMMQSGERIEYGEGRVALSFRVIDVKTKQVKYADSVCRSYTDEDIRKASGSNTIREQGNVLLSLAADQVGEQILNAIYPVKIIGISAAGHVTLNQGGRGVIIDSMFDVFRLGEEKYDPYTKESLGAEEICVGCIRITDVKSKQSTAVIVDGGKSILEGCICRPSKRKDSGANKTMSVEGLY